MQKPTRGKGTISSPEMPLQTTYLRYADSVEVEQPNEAEDTQTAIAAFREMSRFAFDKHRHAVRGAHAKSHGILKGELQIYDNLPPVEWPEDESPYRPIARLIIPVQEAYSSARRVYADDVLSFSPFHCLPEHRPLGSIMRARKEAYEDSSRYRHEMNAQPRREPKNIDELPD